MRFYLSAFLMLSAVSCLRAQSTSQAQSQPKPQPDNVEAFLKTQMRKRHIPGLQIAVVRHGKIVFLHAYGLASIQDSLPVSNQTVFSINSITKAFTGVAIMQLAEAGKLELSAPVSRYLNGLPAEWQVVTIRQLLTHASGLPNIMDNNGKMVADGGDDMAWAKVQTLPMDYAPGERFSYNQTNYLLLGRIIDKLSGLPFSQYIKEQQLDIVGMPRTVFGDSHDIVPKSARGYTFFRNVGGEIRRTDKLGNVFEEFSPFLRTASGMSSTAEEMAHWIIALQKGQLFKVKTSLSTLWTPGLLNNGSIGGFSRLLNGYALGWPTASRSEHHALTPVGGGRAALFVYPDDDLAVVILTNLQAANPEDFMDEVAGYYISDMRASNGFGLPPVIKTLHKELKKRGFDHAFEVVNEAKAKDAAFHLQEEDVNAWGYRLLEYEQTKEALAIFKLNVRLYPESANAYDSLAEVYETVGEKALAIQNYRRSLELNPKNTNAVEHLKKLEPDGTTNGLK